MDNSVQVYKFYNLGSPLSKQDILTRVKELDYKTVEKYSYSTEIVEPDFISYPEPISFYLSRKFSWQGESISIVGKIYTYGALSLKVDIPLETGKLEKARKIMNEKNPEEQIEEVFDALYEDIAQNFNDILTEEDKITSNFNHTYCIFCFSNTGQDNVKEIVNNNRNNITALLSGMYQAEDFSEEQKKNALSHHTRFYKGDYSIVHWNNALVIDNNADFSEKIYIIELANIQFIKLQVYDEFIDNYLSDYLMKAKRTFRGWLPHLMPGISKKIKDIARIRVELEKITDIMDNFEKFFGRWYLAKIYYMASSAFEIKRWRKLISSRMNTVNELYSVLNEEINRSKMLFLNVLTLILFILWFVTG